MASILMTTGMHVIGPVVASAAPEMVERMNVSEQSRSWHTDNSTVFVNEDLEEESGTRLPDGFVWITKD